MLKNRILGATTALVLAATSVGLGASAAHADDDDRVTVSGHASRNAQYAFTVAERDDDRLRATVKIDSAHAGKKWTVTVYRNGKKVAQSTERTAKNGNVTIARTVRGDDDDRVKVVAKAGYGERFTRTIDLDDDDFEARSGKGTKGTRYGYTVRERDDDRATAELRVNGTKKKAKWTVSFYRDGRKVATQTKRANSYGNVVVAKTFRADDDRIKVVAKSAYGAKVTRTIDMDD